MRASPKIGSGKRSQPARGTYLYCIVASGRRPALPRTRRGVSGLGPVRLLPLPAAPGGEAPHATALWLVAADAPLADFDEAALNRRLSDLDWVSRAAVAHEAVVESFLRADAVLPMKLFTLFTSDERAVAHVAARRTHIERLLQRVARHDEWSVRVMLARDGAAPPARPPRGSSSGTSYLATKKAHRDTHVELARRSKRVVADLFDRLASEAGDARRRAPSEMPVQNGPLVLDAAFLVPRARASKFRAALTRQARRLEPRGYRVSLTGPWPPYSFMQDA